MRWLAVLLAAVVVAGSAAGATGPAASSAAFLAGRQSPGGGFAEQGRAPDATLTAWAALGLVAAGGSPAERARAAEFLQAHPATPGTDADVALQVVALSALGERIDEATLARLRAHKPGTLVNETIWAIIALRAAGEQPPPALVQGLIAAQAKGGGFSWSRQRPSRLERHCRRDRGSQGRGRRTGRRAPGAHGARFVSEQGRRLRADEGPRVRRAIDGLGDPGSDQLRAAAGKAAVPVPVPPPPCRRQLPLLAAVRDDARVGHLAGAAGARGEAVSVALIRTRSLSAPAACARPRSVSSCGDERAPQ